MAWTTPKTWVAASILTAAELNTHVRDNENQLRTPSQVKVRRSATQAITTATWQAINFTVEDYDTNSFHDNVTNNTRLTISEAGLYLFTGACEFASNATGDRGLAITKNAGVVFQAIQLNDAASIAHAVNISAVLACVASDYFELRAWQNSGANLNVNSTADFTVWFAANRVG